MRMPPYMFYGMTIQQRLIMIGVLAVILVIACIVEKRKEIKIFLIQFFRGEVKPWDNKPPKSENGLTENAAKHGRD